MKEVLWKMHKYMNLSMDELYRMTVADRLLFTTIHNKVTSEENEKSGLK